MRKMGYLVYGNGKDKKEYFEETYGLIYGDNLVLFLDENIQKLPGIVEKNILLDLIEETPLLLPCLLEEKLK